ncbi:glycerophosphodiester phosphodiesterase [Kiloniella litopenaei]|uniref:glycerophosphodiester phosphodiesterase n=1 Tax=Kiloniella litopenaei TaxID=1549748 RepID=UPI003BAA28EC
MTLRQVISRAFVILAVFGLTQPVVAENISKRFTDLGAIENFDLQGHRGARGLAPENTLAGFSKALELGVTTLELDTGVTRDGVVVIHHDPYLNSDIARDTKGNWVEAKSLVLKAMTYQDLASFNVGALKPGSKYAKRFAQQKSEEFQSIPRLSDLFDLVTKSGNNNVRFNVETKINPLAPDMTVNPEAFVGALLAVINKHGMWDRVTIQSFDWRTLQLVQKRAPDIPTVYLSAQQKWLDNIAVGQKGTSGWTAGFDVDDYAGSIPKMVKSAGGSVWSPFYRELTPELVQEAHKEGLKVIPWTVNNPEDFLRLIKMGVDGIITDYPDINLSGG